MTTTVQEAINIVRGTVPYPIIAADMERAGNVLADEVETLREERDALRGDLRYLLADSDVTGALTGYQRDLLTRHLGET